MPRPNIEEIEARAALPAAVIPYGICLREDIPALIAYIRELEPDKQRLDWLEKHGDSVTFSESDVELEYVGNPPQHKIVRRVISDSLRECVDLAGNDKAGS